MKLLIVRHGDPDYTIDSLTEKGWKEVEFLSEKLSKLDIKDFYVSPLGRAKDTASLTLKKMNRTATECDWLREFDVLIDRPDVTDRKIILWDWLPQDWSMDERFYQYDHWFENERLQAADTKKHYDYVTGEFDKLLAEHGYVREGHYYRVEKANNDTIVFFCHSGNRTANASDLLERLAGDVQAYRLDGGISGWEKAGLPVEHISSTIPLFRQIQIAAGSLVLIGVIGSAFWHPFFWLSAFVGAGLVFAGISGFCGLGVLLSHMPWNRR